MKPLEATELKWADARVDAFVDDALPAADRQRFEALLVHPEVAVLAARARAVQAALRGMTAVECPEEVVHAVLARTSRAPHFSTNGSAAVYRAAATPTHPAPPPPSVRWQPDRSSRSRRAAVMRRVVSARALVGIAAAMLFGALVFFQFTNRSDTADGPAAAAGGTAVDPAAPATPEEVARALQEARWALQYVSDLGRSTGRPVRHVVQQHMAVPVRDAVSHMLHDGAVRRTDGELIQEHP